MIHYLKSLFSHAPRTHAKKNDCKSTMSNLDTFFEELSRPPVQHDYARIQAETRLALERSARGAVAAAAKRAAKRRAQMIAAAAARAKARRVKRQAAARIKRALIRESRHRAILRNEWPEYTRLVRHPDHVPSDRRSPPPNFTWNYRSPSLSLDFGGYLPPRTQTQTQSTYARATPSRHHTQVPANVPETPSPRRFTQ